MPTVHSTGKPFEAHLLLRIDKIGPTHASWRAPQNNNANFRCSISRKSVDAHLLVRLGKIVLGTSLRRASEE